MAEKLVQKQPVSVEEALEMEIFISQALIDILIEKGIFTQEDLMKKIEKLRSEMR